MTNGEKSTLLGSFDATYDPDLLDTKTWEYLRDNWWVCGWNYRNGYRQDEDASPQNWSWCMSMAEPRPVPNPDMKWRRPTYGEAMERVHWLRRVKAGEVRDSDSGTKYARSA